jgi:hypothetical protein
MPVTINEMEITVTVEPSQTGSSQSATSTSALSPATIQKIIEQVLETLNHKNER